MKTVTATGQFRRDFKKYEHQRAKLEKLYQVIDTLRRGEQLPAKHRLHALVGQYVGCLECHVESDFLLIWIDESTNIIRLVRVGTHSELFG